MPIVNKAALKCDMRILTLKQNQFVNYMKYIFLKNTNTVDVKLLIPFAHRNQQINQSHAVLPLGIGWEMELSDGTSAMGWSGTMATATTGGTSRDWRDWRDWPTAAAAMSNELKA